VLLGSSLDRAKNGGHFALKVCEFQIDYARARMKYDVDRNAQERKLPANRFAHAPLDAIAMDGIPQYLAYRQTDASTLRVGATQRMPVCAFRGAQQEEVTHLFTELLAAAGIYALIVGMFAQPASGGNHKDPLVGQVTVVQVTVSLP
jgi:hypothetical protein